MGSPTALTLPNNSMFRRTRSTTSGASEQEQQQQRQQGLPHLKISSRNDDTSKEHVVGSYTKDTFANNFRTLFRLASKQQQQQQQQHHHGSRNNSRRGQRQRQQQQQRQRKARGGKDPQGGGVRRSTSTAFTRSTTNRSSIFFEPMTMDDFLMAEELAAFEETKEEIVAHSGHDHEHEHDDLGGTAKTQLGCTWKTIEEEIERASSSAQSGSFETVSNDNNSKKPLNRIPPPESYFEMTKNIHEELGNIQFEYESLEEAQQEAERRQRPILCIEAQIPGDTETGQTIFSHPLIVEAAESLFVTVQPRQLEPQDDEEEDEQHDRRFFRSSSCRTRVRVLDDKGIDVVAPVEHMSTAEVVSALVRGLESFRTHVPQYLQLLLEEEAGKLQVLSKTRFREIQGEALFGMFDSVLAEVEFAGLDGVLSTRSGALVRQQVVRVTYDSRRLSYGALVRHALRRTGTNVIYYETNDERIAAQLEVQHFRDYRKVQQRYADDVVNDTATNDNDKESIIKVMEVFGNIRTNPAPKPALRESILRFVPLTNLQSTRANRLIHNQKFDEAMHLLSPRQGLIAMQALRAHHSKHFQDVVDVPICSAWNELAMTTQDNDVLPLIDKLHYVTAQSGNDDDDDGDDEESTESLTEEGEDPLPLIQ